MASDTDSTEKTMRLRYAGRCSDCHRDLAAGTVAVYDRATRTVHCVTCTGTDSTPPEQIVSGPAGESAAKKFQQLHDAREKRIRDAHPKLGGLILALTDDPQSTKAWATGSRGEQQLGRWLDDAATEHVHPLHDRRIPGTRANIDHLVITPQGVFVIDAKKYQGRVEHRVDGGFLSPRIDKLIVGRRDCTKLVPGVVKQVERVRVALDAAGLTDVPAYGMLCFVDAEWGLFSRPFTIGAVTVLWPRRAADYVARSGALTAETTQRTLRVLAKAFPAYG
ncbi:ribosomal protein S27E [Leifsonia sp. EB41]|uniref:nuclease-related domain-containing protein n=1 Tax=Leifsonia sp. EB41 TaxID=3156260 RepID=UPI003515361D